MKKCHVFLQDGRVAGRPTRGAHAQLMYTEFVIGAISSSNAWSYPWHKKPSSSYSALVHLPICAVVFCPRIIQRYKPPRQDCGIVGRDLAVGVGGDSSGVVRENVRALRLPQTSIIMNDVAVLPSCSTSPRCRPCRRPVLGGRAVHHVSMSYCWAQKVEFLRARHESWVVGERERLNHGPIPIRLP